ncbi:MAG: acyl-CoA thioesterase, partial [Candidatus Poribacteria bacterium]|nr:acyl-CoA thioesterase [Candidatus Poribacteria bacterium]
IAHSNAQGWSSERYKQIGSSWVVRSHHIEYILPAFVNDEIVIYTWISSLHKIRSLRKYKFVRTHDQSVLVTAETNWVFFDFQRQRPRSVLPEISSAYEIVPEDEEP